MENPTSICELTDIDQYMTMPAEATITAQWLVDTWCQFNESVILAESEQFNKKFQKPMEALVR